MTRRAPIRQADIKRTVKAALEAGMRVDAVVVKPDGTVLIRSIDVGLPKPFTPAPEGENEWDVVLQ